MTQPINGLSVQEKLSPYRWIVLVAILLACSAGAFAQYVLSIYGAQLMDSLQINTSQYSAASTAPMFCGVLLSIFVGFAADRLGAKIGIVVAGLLGVAGAVLRLYAGSFPALFASMFLIGFFPVVVSSSSVKLISSWFPEKELGVAMGVFMAAGSVGAALAQIVCPRMPSYEASCLLSLVLVAATWVFASVFIKDGPNKDQIASDRSQRGDFSALCRLKYLWIVCASGFFVMGFGTTINVFMPTAMNMRGMSMVDAGTALGVESIFALLGNIIGPAIVFKFFKNHFRPVCLGLGLIAAFFMFAAWQICDFIPTTILLAIASTAAGALIPCLMTVLVLVPGMRPEYTGSAGGFTNTFRFLGAVVLPSYIFAPIAGTDFNLIFIFSALSIIISAALFLLFPNVFKNRSDAQIRDAERQAAEELIEADDAESL